MNRTAPIVAAAAATTTLGPTPGEKTTKSLHFTVRLQHLFIKQLHSTAQHLLLFLDAHELCQLSTSNKDLRYTTLRCNHAWFRINTLYKIMPPNKKRNAARAGTTKAYKLCRHLMTMKLRNGKTRPPLTEWINSLIDPCFPHNSVGEFLKNICNGSYSEYNILAWKARDQNVTPIWYRCRRVHPERGERVRIVGIVGRPELNGMIAVKLKWLDQRNRWNVKVESDEGKKEVMALKPNNLEQMKTEHSDQQDKERFTTDRAGHRMKISSYQYPRRARVLHLGSYADGTWYCDKCASKGAAGSERWFCKQCQCDVCFKCFPSLVGDTEEEEEGVQWKWEWDWTPTLPTGGSTAHLDVWFSTAWAMVPSDRVHGIYAGQAPAPANQNIIEFLQCVSPHRISFDNNKQQNILMVAQKRQTIDTLTSEELELYRQQILEGFVANLQGENDDEFVADMQALQNLSEDEFRQFMRERGGDAVFFPA